MVYEKAYAKLNLLLDVVGKREDGYHQLKTIMIPLELHDELTFLDSDSDVVESSIIIPNNVILKTILWVKQTYQIDRFVRVQLKKNIPIGSGLGGGSANVAATLRGLNQLWDMKLSQTELEKAALALGSDTLFCLYNESALIQGRGEHLTFIEKPPIESITLLIPPVEVSTKTIFSQFKNSSQSMKFEKVFQFYKNGDWASFFKHTYNQLLPTTLETYPELKKWYKKLQKVYPDIQMSGSGSAFYLINNQNKKTILLKKWEKTGLKVVETCINS